MNRATLFSVGFSILAAGSFTWAGAAADDSAKAVLERPVVTLESVGWEVDYTGTSDFKKNRGADERAGGGGNDETSTWHEQLSYGRLFPLAREGWFAGVGLQASRFDFQSNASLAPNTLQSYAVPVGLEYRPGGFRVFFIETSPGLYFSRDVSTAAFDLPTIAVTSLQIGKGQTYLLAGVSFSLLRENPVLPLVGVLWQVNEQWGVRAILPEPKLVYRVSETLEIWGGGELAGGTFVSNERSGEGGNRKAAKLNGTPVSYSEVRAGVGLDYTGWKVMKVHFAAGYAFSREFDYYRAGIVQETDGAPYVKLAGELNF